MSSKPQAASSYVLTPEAIKKREERKAKKEAKAALNNSKQAEAILSRALDESVQKFAKREWEDLPGGAPEEGQERWKIVSWNMLAQALVRRDLFPGSDCLKWQDRGPYLIPLLLSLEPDIVSLQEVDASRYPAHLSVLSSSSPSYSSILSTGYTNKLHGLAIAWRNDKFEAVEQLEVRLDDEELAPGVKGGSRKTRNIGLILALRRKGGQPAKGLILVNLHLYWHPRYHYERSRQVFLLLLRARAFQASNPAFSNYPIILAGDFNIQPNEATYFLLSGWEGEEGHEEWERSKVVHKSIWEAGKEGEEVDAEEGGGEEGDEDRLFKDVRASTPTDGMPSFEQMRRIFGEVLGPNKATSAYGSFQHILPSNSLHKDSPNGSESPFYFSRRLLSRSTGSSLDPEIRRGDFEPRYTSVTPYWKCTLDYIWVLRSSQEIKITKLLRLPGTRLLDESAGLPRKGICPSDHLAIGAELEL